MSPDNPFLKALLAQPDDDTLRLAMADWLDENDQAPRSEFIKVQLDLARGVADRDRRNALEVRQRDLLLAHEAEWVAPLADVLECGPDEWGGWVFRRGFVEYFHLPAEVANRRGAHLSRLTPVRELYLRPCPSPIVMRLCTKEWLRGVTHLYLPSATLSSAAVVALIRCPYLGNLRHLDCVLQERVPQAQRDALAARFGAAVRFPGSSRPTG